MGGQSHIYGVILPLTLMVLNVSCFAIDGSLSSFQGVSSSSRVGEACNIVAAHLLKTNAESDQNCVFSPLGYTSILAILSEGARGDTFTDITNLLRHSLDQIEVRGAYRSALSHLQGDNPLNAPQFKTWLYIYRNNSVNDEFKQALRQNYFVDVKDIDRLNLNDMNDDFDTKVSATESDNSKDIPELVKLMHPHDGSRINDDQHDASKFDEVVEDKQYVEVPVIREEILQQKKEEKEKLADVASEASVSDTKNPNDDQFEINHPKETESARMRVPLKSFDNFEILETKESHFDAREFGSRGDGDVASVISGNSLSGKPSNASEDDPDKLETKLILFNGLYYRGSWEIPFRQLRADTSNVFYKSENETCTAKMMHALGNFKYADLPDLGARAVELQYDNERYSLLVVLPNSRDGLSKLLNDFNAFTIPRIVEQLSVTAIDLSLPKFNIDSTSGAEKALKQAGLTKMFTPDADFSGISTEQHLHVDELQQHVSVRIDEGSSGENFLTATNAERSNNISTDVILNVDHPFLFVVRDVIDNVLIVAGKLVNPPTADDSNGILSHE